MNSISELTSLRTDLLRVKDTEDVPIVLVGNKCDLETEHVVGRDEGANLALQWCCPFMEVSALTHVNISDAFYELVRLVQAKNGKISAEISASKHKCVETFCITSYFMSNMTIFANERGRYKTLTLDWTVDWTMD